jgi:nitroreductase
MATARDTKKASAIDQQPWKRSLSHSCWLILTQSLLALASYSDSYGTQSNPVLYFSGGLSSLNPKKRREQMFNKLTEKRRSIRLYDDRPVEAEKIDAIIEAALRSPTGMAKRPWTFVVVTDKALLEKLSVAKPKGAAFVKNAPAVVVVCGDPSVSDLWIEDCSIAAVTMQYAAQGLGLGSRWAQMRGYGFDETTTSPQYVARLLGLPDNLSVLCMIAIGYPGEEMIPYRKDELRYDKVSYDRYGQNKA